MLLLFLALGVIYMDRIKKHIFHPLSIAPLITFRVLFGFIMLVSIIRFAYRGWIYELYIEPKYFFTFLGFEWVQPLGAVGMYTIFGVMAISALAIMLGGFYRTATIVFFLSFSYVELIDKSNYLNHYYFVSIMSFLLIFVPAHRSFSLDVLRKPQLALKNVPAWTINIFKLQLVIVYFYAGLAKLNPDWLLNAMPLKIWLPSKSHLPLIGWVFNYEWSAYVFSWFGAIYDLTVAFFLLNRFTRIWAYAAVLAFHIMTAILFQIGMFPYIMMLLTLIFFSASFHEKLLNGIRQVFGFTALFSKEEGIMEINSAKSQPKWILTLLIPFMLFQIVFPFRYVLYPGNLFWTEQGYRFSWRVMLMEKAGYAVFHVRDAASEKREQVRNYDYLTQNQEKMMSTQPDMILQFAHIIRDDYKNKGFIDPVVTVESYVTLNGRRSKPLIDPNVNLAAIENSIWHKDWILPLEKE